MWKYLVIIERGPKSYSAHVPDLPGCVSVGKTEVEVETLIREAIDFHMRGMIEDGLPIPEPTSISRMVEVGAA
jgi:predicted RNase H-like HicB family nuclease